MLIHAAGPKATAVHEAGHVFAMLALPDTPEIDAVWIRKSREGWHGMVECVNPTVELTYSNANSLAVIALAGPVAEIRWRSNSKWGPIVSAEGNAKLAINSDKGQPDLNRALACVKFKNPHSVEHGFIVRWQDAIDIVDANWRNILALADRIKAEGRVPGVELHALAAVSPGKTPG